MNRSPFRIFNPSPIRVNLMLCAGVAVFLLIASPLGIAQEVTSTLSGRVVDVDGNPIAGFPIAVGPLLSIDGVIRPMFLTWRITDDNTRAVARIANRWNRAVFHCRYQTRSHSVSGKTEPIEG